jgi:hypothetical protein
VSLRVFGPILVRKTRVPPSRWNQIGVSTALPSRRRVRSWA